MAQEITIESAIALDDSCQIQFWAKGLHQKEVFVKAVEEHVKDEGRDIPLSAIQEARVKLVYQRVVPCRNNDVSDSRYIQSDKPSRGSYPIMLMDCWFPLHAYES